MSDTIVKFALDVLMRLKLAKPEKEDVKMEVDEAKEEKVNVEPSPESKYIPSSPVTVDNVQQHVELAFALSRRHQDLLDEIFRLYPLLAPDIQDTVEQMLSPLFQSLGATDKLQSILRDFPPGADKLVLRTMTVLSAEGATTVVRELVKALMSERELDPRFIIPIIGTLERVGLVSYSARTALTIRRRSKSRYLGLSRYWPRLTRATSFGQLSPVCCRSSLRRTCSSSCILAKYHRLPMIPPLQPRRHPISNLPSRPSESVSP